MGVKVTELNPVAKTVKTADGKEFSFDKLLLATGGKAIVPPIPGVDKEGISTLKTMADAERIYNMKGKRAVVIGAGSIGVEACISLTRRGIKATLLEQLGQVMPTVFDAEAAQIVRKRIEELGIEVFTGEKALKFTGDKRVAGRGDGQPGASLRHGRPFGGGSVRRRSWPSRQGSPSAT